MPIGKDFPSYPYNYASIAANTPPQSGVYALFKSGVWIYVGESGDIRARLLQHLNGDNPCITQNAPTGFQFELVAANQRVARQDQLIAALKPVCNKKLG
jgi:excinuclease UvrABC nuclease subunit